MSNPFNDKSIIIATVTRLLALFVLTGCLGSDDGGGETLDASQDTQNESVESDQDDDSQQTGECDTSSFVGLVHCVEPTQYWSDLIYIAQERTPGSDHWQAVQDLCATRFESLGFAVERHDYGSGVNVIGTLEGVQRPDEQVLVSAHYDHIRGCDGADDNASGVAGVLEVARVLAQTDHARTLVVACWDEEETGLIGSLAYAERAAEDEDDIVVSYVFDMIGYSSDEPDSQEVPVGLDLLFPEAAIRLEENDYRGDFLIVLNDSTASVAAHAIASYGEQVGFPVEVLELSTSLLDNPLLSDFLRSDHAAFWLYEYSAMMIGDSASYRNPNYHCYGGEDSVDTLNLEFATHSVQVTVGSVAETLAGTSE